MERLVIPGGPRCAGHGASRERKKHDGQQYKLRR
jgi:hypothetical protein